MTNLLGDGFHKKCGLWHKVGQCPIDDAVVNYCGDKTSSRWPQEKSSISNPRISDNNIPSRNSFNTIIEKINRQNLIINSQRHSRKLLEDSIPSSDVNYFKPQMAITIMLTVPVFALCNDIYGETTFLNFVIAFVISALTVAYPLNHLEAKKKESIQKQIKFQYKQTYQKVLELNKSIDQNEKLRDKLVEEFNLIKTKQKSWWLGLDGWTFEKEVARVFERLGYAARPTRGSNDGGIDIYLYKNGKTIVVQCKNHKKQIGPSTIRDIHGVKISTRAHEAFVVSSSGFSENAKKYARNNGIELFDIERIIKI